MRHSDYDPQEVRRTLVREGLSSLAHGLLYPFGYLRSSHRPLRRSQLRTLVFVHGFIGNRANFFPLQAYLRVRGHKRVYSYNYPSVGSVEDLALRLKRELDANVKGGRIDLVAHSMGGLIARYYLQELGGERRVDRLITLGTPHHGTHASEYVPTPLVHQLRPEGAFIRHLGSLPHPETVRTLSIGGGKDLMVLPHDSARCPFGEHFLYEDLGHLSMLLSPRVFAAVHAALAAPPAVPDETAPRPHQ